MGTLKYANSTAGIDIADETLAHVRAVTLAKLRRNESFALTVPKRDGVAETFWMQASIPLQFSLDSSIKLELPLLTAMMEAASTSGGLDLADERFGFEFEPARQLHAMSA